MAYQPGVRKAHWVGLNHQNRIPSRWIAFDTESKKQRTAYGEVQTWRLGTAVRWRSDLKVGNAVEHQHFAHPQKLWEWVTDFCRPKTRTIVWAHNLGYDLRIADAMRILPTLGWHLDWCNMSANVSTMTWRSDRGTLTFTDLYSWLPMPLESIGGMVGYPKFPKPRWDEGVSAWRTYCLRDTMIVYRAVSEIIAFVREQDLGNWQPTGAGMAFATWRHKFMSHKVLVHDDEDALAAERKAMHTGRAEAWRHGDLKKDTWVECDLRQAYVHIAAENELPTKLKWHNGPITLHQYSELARRFRVLARVDVHTAVPSVPCHHRGRTIWPVGSFSTWLWDCELDAAIGGAKRVDIRECYIYTRAPILSDWARWVLDVQEWKDERATPVVRKWIKHSGRTLIGRIALRTAQWAVWGANPHGEIGVSYEVDADTGRVYRLMHAGGRTFREESRIEGHDSLPQVTGWITAQCRVMLWEAMQAAGEENIAHVDTDSLIVNMEGLRRLREKYGETFEAVWQIKHTYQRMTVYGPRNYRADGVRTTAGIPVKATEKSENKFVGESWSSMGRDLAEGRTDSVTVTDRQWTMKTRDPRRVSLPGGSTRTRPVALDQKSNDSVSSAPTVTGGS